MLHKHKCTDRTCNRIWQHDDKTLSIFELDEAHRCPDCGRENTKRHFESEAEFEAFVIACREEERLELQELRKMVTNNCDPFEILLRLAKLL